MKTAVIGAGNMGSAIAVALRNADTDIRVSNPSQPKLDRIRSHRPGIHTTNSNREAADGADIIILAVKPWVMPAVIEELRDELQNARAIVSVAAGIEPADLAGLVGSDKPAYFYLIPNTAVAVGEGMTFYCTQGADEKIEKIITDMLSGTGKLIHVTPREMTAGMAVASCGMAYAMRYIRAAAQGGVELGLRPSTATAAVAQTLRGAAALLESRGSHPEEEIDRVTTPGGVTIKGLNAMEAAGFSAAVVAGIKASRP